MLRQGEEKSDDGDDENEDELKQRVKKIEMKQNIVPETTTVTMTMTKKSKETTAKKKMQKALKICSFFEEQCEIVNTKEQQNAKRKTTKMGRTSRNVGKKYIKKIRNRPKTNVRKTRRGLK